MKTLDLGRKDYSETLQLQKQLVEERAKGQIQNTLVFVEHDPVYTKGRAASSVTVGDAENEQEPSSEQLFVPKLGSIPVLQVERGGKLTFHGPGQIVGYPIFHLSDHDLRKYLRDMERVLMHALQSVTGFVFRPCPETLFLEPGQLQTGIWIGDKKIASIGIAVRKWVSYHGFALNFSTDLRYFQATEPCGFSGQVMTSLEHELRTRVGKINSKELSMVQENLKKELIQRFSEISEGYESSNNLAKRNASADVSELGSS